MGQIKFTMSLIFIALFTVAIIGFAVQFASDNGTSVSLADDPELTNLRGGTEDDLLTFKGEAKETYESIIDSSIETGDTTPSGGQFAITPITVIGIVYNILNVGWLKIFGGDPNFAIFLTAFLGVLGFMIGMYVWKTWRGNPD